MAVSQNRRHLAEANRQGRLEAERLRNRLGLNTQTWIDVFEIIESQPNLELLFRPLKKLYGFYLQRQGSSGIVINADHPSALRRFTAAHELGHHVLSHGESVDLSHGESVDLSHGESVDENGHINTPLGIDDEGVDGIVSARSIQNAGNLVKEAAAQGFAGSFLMPLAPVNRYLRDHTGSTRGGILPADQVYKLAVEFGASFGATCTQLAALNKIDWEYRAQLLQAGALKVATDIGYGTSPRHRRADVVVGDHLHGAQVMEHDAELVVEIVETPTTGCVWTLDEIPRQLEVIADSVVADEHDGERLGGSQTRHIRFGVVKPGDAVVRFGLRAAWQPESEPLQSRVVEVSVREPVFNSGCSLSRRTLRRRVAMVHAMSVM